MEVYVDNLVVKSKFAQQHPQHLAKVFVVLRDHWIKLNPIKCTFGVTNGYFLGYLVTQWGIEANPDQIRAVQEMTIPTSQKEVQELIRKIVALSRFFILVVKSTQTNFCRVKEKEEFAVGYWMHCHFWVAQGATRSPSYPFDT